MASIQQQSDGPNPTHPDPTALKPSQHSEYQDQQPKTPPPKPDYTSTTHKKSKKIANPYSIRKPPKEDRIRIRTTGELISILKEYISIIIGHDPNKETETWYRLWTSWKSTGTLEPDITILALATLVKLPENKHQDIKAVTLHIPDTLPILQRYTRVPWKTKHKEPILYLTKSTIVAATTKPSKIGDTPLLSNKMPTMGEQSASRAQVTTLITSLATAYFSYNCRRKKRRRKIIRPLLPPPLIIIWKRFR